MLVNRYSEKLKEELEREERQKPFFEITDFEKISEIKKYPRAALDEPNLDDNSQTFTDTLLEDLFSEKLQFAGDVVEQLNAELNLRKYIAFQNNEEIENEIKELSLYLRHLHSFNMKESSFLRANTRRQITDLQKERHANRVVTWQDTVTLRARQREHIERYNALVRTRALLQI